MSIGEVMKSTHRIDAATFDGTISTSTCTPSEGYGRGGQWMAQSGNSSSLNQQSDSPMYRRASITTGGKIKGPRLHPSFGGSDNGKGKGQVRRPSTDGSNHSKAKGDSPLR